MNGQHYGRLLPDTRRGSLRSALWLATGAVVLGAAMLLGLIVMAVFLVSLLIAGTVLWLRAWWRGRGRGHGPLSSQDTGQLIEGEFRVVDRQRDRRRRPGDGGLA